MPAPAAVAGRRRSHPFSFLADPRRVFRDTLPGMFTLRFSLPPNGLLLSRKAPVPSAVTTFHKKTRRRIWPLELAECVVAELTGAVNCRPSYRGTYCNWLWSCAFNRI